MSKYVQRNHRILKEQDAGIKALAARLNLSENAVVREMLDVGFRFLRNLGIDKSVYGGTIETGKDDTTQE